jgi:hypothetical protein
MDNREQHNIILREDLPLVRGLNRPVAYRTDNNADIAFVRVKASPLCQEVKHVCCVLVWLIIITVVMLTFMYCIVLNKCI